MSLFKHLIGLIMLFSAVIIPVSSHAAVSTDGLLAYYPFNGSADEESNKTPAGVVSGAITAADRFGRIASAYRFNGENTSIEMQSIPAYFSGDFAVSFWEKAPASAKSTRMHALSLGSSSYDNLDFDFNGGVGLWVFWNGGGGNAIKAGEVGEYTDDSWHHVLLQRSGVQVQLYIDGMLKGTKEYSKPIGSQSLMRIGRSSAGSDLSWSWGPYWWNGAVDDVRIYSRALSGNEIFTLAGSLLAYYPFNGSADEESNKTPAGVVSGAITAADRFGRIASAYRFNGENTSIEMQSIPAYFSGDFAVSFWEKAPASAKSTRMHALSLGSSSYDNLDFDFNGGVGLWVFWNGGGGNAIKAGEVGEYTDDSWHHVLLQRSGVQVQLYIDGMLKGTTEYSKPIGSQSLMRIGRSSAGSDLSWSWGPYWWNGVVDDVRIYSGALAKEQIVSLVYQWKQVKLSDRLQFLPRDGAGGLNFDNKMWLLGGWDPGMDPSTNSQVWSSTDGLNWFLDAIAPWEGRHAAGYVVFNDKMWVVGGDNNSGHYQNDVWSSADGVTWDLATASVPWSNRATHYTLVFDNKIWVMGGQEIWSSTGVVAYNNVYYTEDGVNWVQATPHAGWSPRGLIMGNVVFQGKMWVIGGGTYDVRSYNNDVWNSVDGVNWEQVTAGAPWAPRQYHSVMVFDNKIWVLAGDEHDPDNIGGSNDVWYSSDGKTWTQLSNTPWPGRHAATVINYNNCLWVIAGSATSLFSDVWKLTYAP